ncbi:MAG: flagellar hook-basal body complex protein, partial [Butyrivibrio sp.]|nr:flagellar hook-basal body complex protein [Butyrivibrio sp.]
GISFGTDGSVYGTYSNGQTIKKAQIAVAEFANAMGLEKAGENLYSASLNSGAPRYGYVTENGGYLSSGVVESSNVDLAKEFTDMITTQRGFQANSRVITTSDEMLQILKGLKR